MLSLNKKKIMTRTGFAYNTSRRRKLGRLEEKGSLSLAEEQNIKQCSFSLSRGDEVAGRRLAIGEQ